MKGKPCIVGSDCTLPTEISPERIHCVVEAVEKLSGKQENAKNKEPLLNGGSLNIIAELLYIPG